VLGSRFPGFSRLTRLSTGAGRTFRAGAMIPGPSCNVVFQQRSAAHGLLMTVSQLLATLSTTKPSSTRAESEPVPQLMLS
jgi:hypothetical protein